MNKYLISYDLKNHASFNNYVNLYEAIKKISGRWWHYLDSTWIVRSDMTAAQIATILRSHIHTSDNLLVIKIDANDRGGWLPTEAWKWLNS